MSSTDESPQLAGDDNTLAFDYVKRLASQRFYGDVTLKFQNGQVVRLVREESLIPNLLPDNRRTNADNNTR